MAYNPDHAWDPHNNRAYHGASIESLARLGNRLGYAFLGNDWHDCNSIFVRRDLLEQSGFPEVTGAQSYHNLPNRYPPDVQLNLHGAFVEQ